MIKTLINYIIQTFRGLSDPELRGLLREGLSFLRKNLWLPIIAFLLALPFNLIMGFIDEKLKTKYESETHVIISEGLAENLAKNNLAEVFLRDIPGLAQSAVSSIDDVLHTPLVLPGVILAFFIPIGVVFFLKNYGRGNIEVSKAEYELFLTLAAILILDVIFQLFLLVTHFHEIKAGSAIYLVFFALANIASAIILMPLLYILILRFIYYKISEGGYSRENYVSGAISSYFPLFLFWLILSLCVAILGKASEQIQLLCFSPSSGYARYSFLKYFLPIFDISAFAISYFAVMMPMLIVINKYGLKASFKTLLSWHSKLPKMVSSPILFFCIIFFAVRALFSGVEYFTLQHFAADFKTFFLVPFKTLITIILSSWAVVCLMLVIKQLRSADGLE